MKFIKPTAAMLSVLIAGFSTAALANSDKIKIFTSIRPSIHMPMPNPIYFPVEISVMINGQLMLLSNHEQVKQWDMNPKTFDSYVEVARSFNSQEISQAKFSAVRQGKKFNCSAIDLPLYVQEGEYGVGTNITFSCDY